MRQPSGTQTAFNQWWVGEGQHTVRVHLHHDHRDSLMADPDDPGPSLSLSRLLIGGGSLWGVGLSLTWLIRLAGGLGGRGLSFHAGRHRGTQVHLQVDERESTQISRLAGRRAVRTYNGNRLNARLTCTGMWWCTAPGRVTGVA